MKKNTILLSAAVAAIAASSFAAAPQVAHGFVSWKGIEDRSHVAGRWLTQSDMRGRIAVVVQLEAKKFAEQLMKAGVLQELAACPPHDVTWETYVPERDVVVVYTAVGGSAKEGVAKFWEGKKYEDLGEIAPYAHLITVYDGVTCDIAPQVQPGQYPFVYVVGPGEAKPLLAETFAGATKAKVDEIVNKFKGQAKEYVPYFGTVAQPKFFPKLALSLASGKPSFSQVVNEIHKNVASRRKEVADEAQMLYDAIEQRKSELMFVIEQSAEDAPHVAMLNMDELLTRWPSYKKSMEPVLKKIKAIPDAEQAGRLYVALKKYASPGFVPRNHAAAKKAVAELAKMKATLQKMTTSKTVSVQNAVGTMLSEIDSVMTEIPLRVPGPAKK